MDLNIERMIECRERIGITRMEVARRIGVSQPAYVRYEKGSRMPSVQVIKEIASVLHTSVDYLMGVTDSPEVNTLEVTKANDEVLFRIVEHCMQMDPTQKKRVLTYVKRMLDRA